MAAAKVVQVGFRWSEDVRDALADAARAADRSASAQSEVIVADWLRKEGWLKPGGGRAATRRRSPAKPGPRAKT